MRRSGWLVAVLAGTAAWTAAATRGGVLAAVSALLGDSAELDREECVSTHASWENVNKALVAAIDHNATGLSLLPRYAANADVSVRHDTRSRKFRVDVTKLHLLPEPGNRELIGAHLHTGRAVVNGPININLCGSPPLPPPALAGVSACPSASDFELTLHGGFSSTANDATAVPGATTLGDGAATSYDELAAALSKCTRAHCPVFFNLHTNYSFELNPGAWGVARGQLRPVKCSDDQD